MLQSKRTPLEKVAARRQKQANCVDNIITYHTFFFASITFPPPSMEWRARSTPTGAERRRSAFNVGQLSYRALFSTKYRRTEVGCADIIAMKRSERCVSLCTVRDGELCFFSCPVDSTWLLLTQTPKNPQWKIKSKLLLHFLANHYLPSDLNCLDIWHHLVIWHTCSLWSQVVGHMSQGTVDKGLCPC